jgi:hypothetical protein
MSIIEALVVLYGQGNQSLTQRWENDTCDRRLGMENEQQQRLCRMGYGNSDHIEHDINQIKYIV